VRACSNGEREEGIMLEMSPENRRVRCWCGSAVLGFLLLSGCCTLQAAGDPESGGTPTQEVFDQEVVEIRVDYRAKRISVEPERAKIYFQWSREGRDRLKPVQARWLVKGLDKDHVLHIVPKDKAPKGVFPIPGEFGRREAYTVEGGFNSIVSGEVLRLPKLVKDKGYVDLERGESFNADRPYTVVWPYDVIVANRDGEVLFQVDPEIIILGHP
jgi:hypothetical protein